MGAGMRKHLVPLFLASAVHAFPSPVLGGDDRKVDFTRDIRPVLAEKCITCHGPDEKSRKGKLRLDRRQDVFEDRGGYFTIVPGKPKESELWLRMSDDFPEDRMPPPEAESMSDDELELLRRWIEEGAVWDEHWAFQAPKKSPVPESSARVRGDLDRFVLAKLDEAGLGFSKPADRTTLARRLSLDLLGLPPTPREVADFVAEDSDGAYERYVDRLLASPHFGERWALPWLDAARYADTNGYHRDATRTMWLWRDQLIRSLNENQPYDRFVVEQLAGDLLPDATVEQQIASGFNRNHMLNDEGGAIPEEYQVEYVVDRVRTTSTVFMGLTMACAQCHDHKYDPISQEDYYRFYAFFNKLPEQGLDGSNGPAEPSLVVPREVDLDEIARLEEDVEAVRARMRAPIPEVDAREAGWLAELEHEIESSASVLHAASATLTGGAELSVRDDGSMLVTGKNPDQATYELVFETELETIHGIWLELLRHESLTKGGVARTTHGNFVVSEIEVAVESLSSPELSSSVRFTNAVADYSQVGYEIEKAIDGDPKSGWAADGDVLPENRNALFVPDGPFGYEDGTRLRITLQQNFGGKHTLGHFRLNAITDPSLTAEHEPIELSDWSMLGPIEGDPDELYRVDNGPEAHLDLEAGHGELGWERVEIVDGEPYELEGERSAFYFYNRIKSPDARTLRMNFGSDDSIVVWLNGRRVRENNAKRPVGVDQELLSLQLRPGDNELLCKLVNYGGPAGFAFRIVSEGPRVLDGELTGILRRDARTAADGALVRDHYRRTVMNEWQVWTGRISDLEGRIETIRRAAPALMVMRDEPGVRMTRMLERGRYDRPGREVTAAGPEFLPPVVARRKDGGDELDRLDLANWMVTSEHPLTARVAVNRVWFTLFGRGLVDTVEDFGTQGGVPVHASLLDHLAVTFVENGWDLKRLIRDIVTSTTYRQSSAVTPEILEVDPHNELFARAPRYRLEAEFLRDAALRAASLLTESVGGPSVRPYQPEGLWEEVSFNNRDRADSDFYTPDTGEKLYRRSMYTFWKRSLPPPNLQTLDAPTREICVVRRDRTNTPLQALVLLNDPTFVEAARVLAERVLLQADSREEALRHAFQRALSRDPSAEERELLLAYVAEQRESFAADPGGASELLAVGEFRSSERLDPSEHAAWTLVCSLILNLDEFLTRS